MIFFTQGDYCSFTMEMITFCVWIRNLTRKILYTCRIYLCGKLRNNWSLLQQCARLWNHILRRVTNRVQAYNKPTVQPARVRNYPRPPRIYRFHGLTRRTSQGFNKRNRRGLSKRLGGSGRKYRNLRATIRRDGWESARGDTLQLYKDDFAP